MSLSCLARQWSRRLSTADNVIQVKKRARPLSRDSATSCVSEPKGPKISLKSASRCCVWHGELVESKSRDWDTILTSHSTTSSTLRSSSSAFTRTTTETHPHTDTHHVHTRTQPHTHTHTHASADAIWCCCSNFCVIQSSTFVRVGTTSYYVKPICMQGSITKKVLL